MTQPSTTTAVERNLRRGSGDPDALLQIRIGAKDKRKQRERNCSGRDDWNVNPVAGRKSRWCEENRFPRLRG